MIRSIIALKIIVQITLHVNHSQTVINVFAVLTKVYLFMLLFHSLHAAISFKFCKNRLSGTRCQKGYDPCQIESPCGAHGQCKAAGPDYKCVCEVGWGGQKCDRPASACESAAQRLSPEAVCLNGGSCVDLQDNISYYCICLQPWSGTRCEVINVSQPCFYPI